MRLMMEPDITVRMYGHGWSGKARSLVFGKDFAEAASQASILLGFNAFNDINLYTSNRAFNSMACGAFLTTKWKGCETMFEGGVEVEYFSSYQEMASKIRELKADKDKRRRIYEAGRRRLEKDHTYKARALELVQIYNEITGRKNGKSNTIIQTEAVA